MSLNLAASRIDALDRISNLPKPWQHELVLTADAVGPTPIVAATRAVFVRLLDRYTLSLSIIETTRTYWQFYLGNSIKGCYIQVQTDEGVADAVKMSAVIQKWRQYADTNLPTK